MKKSRKFLNGFIEKSGFTEYRNILLQQLKKELMCFDFCDTISVRLAKAEDRTSIENNKN